MVLVNCASVSSPPIRFIQHLVLDTYLGPLLSPEEADEAFKLVSDQVLYLPRTALQFSIFGKTFQLPRDKAFFGDVADDGTRPLYRYGGTYNPVVKTWTPVLRRLRDRITQAVGQHCNHLVVNRYLNGSDHIGFHRDKDRDFVPGSFVCTISLGGERVFSLDPQK